MTLPRMPAFDLTVMLFVPGDRPERFQKAVDSGAGAAIVDLEDAVAPENKARARASVREAFAAGLQACVRINSPTIEFGMEDCAALQGLHPLAILIPKVERAEDLTSVHHLAPFIPLLETVRGFRNIDEIAAYDNVVALGFGAYDLCAELGAEPLPEVLTPYRSAIVGAARLAGVAALDAPFLRIGDDAGAREETQRAKSFGFDGKLAIHPSHVTSILETFAPTRKEIAHAQAIVAAIERGGVAVVDGKMVDPPLVSSARRILARAQGRSNGVSA